ncbi:hypothetical protein HU200_018346 [Digitaria exilis]|uniref:Terpene synthase N-terminal domain-containing protein n=1 Tax=Digitaria exilis TaxID=1010633 RepID=A0A835F5V6_9POAL|nr:hypothetical protein HU200_018346 [Digitaria exilis]
MLAGTPLQRLGISYHFEEEIHASLEKLNSVEFKNESFHEISLQFRLLRQEQHTISSGNSVPPPVFLSNSKRTGLVQYIGQELRFVSITNDRAHVSKP